VVQGAILSPEGIAIHQVLQLLDGLHRPEIWTQAKSQGHGPRAMDDVTHRSFVTVQVSQ
jgi:hypothetical protein